MTCRGNVTNDVIIDDMMMMMTHTTVHLDPVFILLCIKLSVQMPQKQSRMFKRSKQRQMQHGYKKSDDVSLWKIKKKVTISSKLQNPYQLLYSHMWAESRRVQLSNDLRAPEQWRLSAFSLSIRLIQESSSECFTLSNSSRGSFLLLVMFRETIQLQLQCGEDANLC